jgi:hypothetical protein
MVVIVIIAENEQKDEVSRRVINEVSKNVKPIEK